MSSKSNLGKVRNPRVTHIGTDRGSIMTDAALEVAGETGVVISASQVVKFLIDHYTPCAIPAMVAHIKKSQFGKE